MSENSVENSVTGIPGRNGGTLLPGGVQGNKGGGRPKDEWKASLRELASSDVVKAHVQATLAEGPSHPWFSRALDYATEHGYGKADSKVELDGSIQIVKGYIGIDPEKDI